MTTKKIFTFLLFFTLLISATSNVPANLIPSFPIGIDCWVRFPNDSPSNNQYLELLNSWSNESVSVKYFIFKKMKYFFSESYNYGDNNSTNLCIQFFDANVNKNTLEENLKKHVNEIESCNDKLLIVFLPLNIDKISEKDLEAIKDCLSDLQNSTKVYTEDGIQNVAFYLHELTNDTKEDFLDFLVRNRNSYRLNFCTLL